MQTDDKRKHTSRQNALKSTGPKTPEGKQASSLNAALHGAYARTLVLPGENAELYHLIINAHYKQWAPTNPIEEILVGQMGITLWRLQRQANAEAAILQIQIQRMLPGLEVEFEVMDPAAAYALALSSLHSSGDAPGQIARLERRLLRHYEKLRDQLLTMRQLFTPDSGGPQNAPTDEASTPNDLIVETKLTEPEAPTNSTTSKTPLCAGIRVKNPHHPIYASLPPLPEANPRPKPTATGASGGV